MDCKYCDYYKPIFTGRTGAAVCTFTGVAFSADVDSLDMEYPCRRLSYDSFLARPASRAVSVGVRGFVDDDWRFFYKHCHAANATNRWLQTN